MKMDRIGAAQAIEMVMWLLTPPSHYYGNNLTGVELKDHV